MKINTKTTADQLRAHISRLTGEPKWNEDDRRYWLVFRDLQDKFLSAKNLPIKKGDDLPLETVKETESELQAWILDHKGKEWWGGDWCDSKIAYWLVGAWLKPKKQGSEPKKNQESDKEGGATSSGQFFDPVTDAAGKRA